MSSSTQSPQRRTRLQLVKLTLICALAASLTVLVTFVLCWVLAGDGKGKSGILVLGGDWKRVIAVPELLKKKPDAPVLLSFTNGETQKGKELLLKSGTPEKQIYADCNAVDTVSNFTTTVDFFKKNKIKEVFVITDPIHMDRALLIGHYIFGAHGIKTLAYAADRPYPTSPYRETPDESLPRAIRDAFRATLWLITGLDLSTITEYIYHLQGRVPQKCSD